MPFLIVEISPEVFDNLHEAGTEAAKRARRQGKEYYLAEVIATVRQKTETSASN